MKKFARILVVLLLIVSAFAGDSDKTGKAARAFEKMKSLEGVWEAKGEDGKIKRVSYQIFAGGTALQEIFELVGEEQKTMVTLYYLDGDNLMLTHYCVANNQPTMRSASIRDDLSEIAFKFVSATNLADPKEGHMYKAVFKFNEDGTFANAWTFRKDGEEAFTEADQYKRVK